jgi:hypothetical protein
LDHNAKLEKCLSSQQCGDINKHQDEKSMVESAHDLKKNQNCTKNSFSEKIRCHLINSNKCKYLVEVSDGSFLPWSGMVNCDIAKLEKYYSRKCSENLERASNLFGTILSNFDNMATNKLPVDPKRSNPAKRRGGE